MHAATVHGKKVPVDDRQRQMRGRGAPFIRVASAVHDVQVLPERAVPPEVGQPLVWPASKRFFLGRTKLTWSH